MSYLQAAAAAFLLLGFWTAQSTSAEEQVESSTFMRANL